MTLPAGTVTLDALVTAPTTRPAAVMVEVAAACVVFTTFGTATSAGPDDTTSETALPLATCVPATGFWLMTDPAGTVVLEACGIVPTVRPAFVIAVRRGALSQSDDARSRDLHGSAAERKTDHRRDRRHAAGC